MQAQNAESVWLDISVTREALDHFVQVMERVSAAIRPTAEAMGRLAVGGIVEGLTLAEDTTEAQPPSPETRAPFLEL